MNDKTKEQSSKRNMSRLAFWGQGFLDISILRRRVFFTVLFASLAAMIYWGLIASDRYISEAHVIVQRTDTPGAQSMNFSSLLGDFGGVKKEYLLLSDHSLSVDMLNKLDEKLNLRAHYSNRDYDVLSRMWSEDVPVEWFHKHYLSRVGVEIDQSSGILVIRVQAYTPEMAHSIANTLVLEGERYINEMARELAREQVAFLESQIKQLGQRVANARLEMIDFQNRTGFVSPEGAVEGLTGIVYQLESKLAELQTMLSAKQEYLMPNSPDVVELELQVGAIKKQIDEGKARLASVAGDGLNQSLEEFQRLSLKVEFETEVFKTALIALERGRVDATRNLEKVSIIQKPTMPQYSLEPRRIYNTVVFVLFALILGGMVHMLAAIVLDHKE